MLDYIVMRMRKSNHEEGYCKAYCKAKQKVKTYIGKIKMTTTRDEHKMTNYTG